MRRELLMSIILAVAVASIAGCAAGASYRKIDLSANLSAETLHRYESEWKASGDGEHMARLEHTNWWLPGLLIYYREAEVMRVDGPNGPTYHVTSGNGFGPLSILYASTTHSTYNAKGERLSGMGLDTVLLGCVAMIHRNDASLADGRHEEMSSAHLIHHLFNIHTMNGHTYASLLTVPNPLGFTTTSGDECHAPATQ